MDHSYFTDRISAYYDGALDPQEMELMRRHLEECPECEKQLEQLSSLSQKITELSGLGGDDYFEKLAVKTENKIAELNEKVTVIAPSHRLSRWWKVGAAAASIILVGTISYYQWFDEGEVPGGPILRSVTPPPTLKPEEDIAAKPDERAANLPEHQGARDERRDTAKPSLNEEKSNGPTPSFMDTREMAVSEAEKPVVIKRELPASAGPARKKPAGVKSLAVDSIGEVLGYIAGSGEEVSPAMTAEVADRESAGADDDETPDSAFLLAQWRQQRDSLQTMFTRMRNLSLESGAKSGRQKEALGGAVEKTQSDSSLYKADSALAQIWLQIGQFTNNKSERQQAIDFLNEFLARNRSDSVIVNSYLKQLEE